MDAAGQFSIPKIPDIPGLETFKGEQWHTVSWPKDADLKGKRVGIIGTGLSAAQLIPKIYKDVSSLAIYQRSPSFCIPRKNYAVSSTKKWIFAHVPFSMKLHKWWLASMVSSI
jgi:cation diffusion facilitator CzcD-associated flavoprotein CzcO